eukprot:scaffold82388_cov35-Tisochrysis_lutea.AAC.3
MSRWSTSGTPACSVVSDSVLEYMTVKAVSLERPSTPTTSTQRRQRFESSPLIVRVSAPLASADQV